MSILNTVLTNSMAHKEFWVFYAIYLRLYLPSHRMFSLWLKITRHTKKENTLLSSDKLGSRTKPRNNPDVRTVRQEHCNYYMDMLKDLVLKVEQNREFQQRHKSYFLRVRWKC